MTRNSVLTAKVLARLATPVLLASLLGACSSVPDWVDPTTWLGSDTTTAGTDQSSAPATTADSGTTPDLASIPPKPALPSTPDEQKQVSDSLAADRTQAQYSAEALQGGTEPVAAPPPAESAPVSPPPVDQTASASTGSASSDTSFAGATATAGAAKQTAAPADSTQVASTEPSATTAPATAAMTAPPAASPQPATSMQVTFAPSQAPALDPSVAQYVPQRILSRYQQTAVAASVPGMQGTGSTAMPKIAHSKAKPVLAEPEAAAPAAQ